MTTALASLADALGTEPEILEQLLLDYDEERLTVPEDRMPGDVLTHFGITAERLDFGGAYYFHGTRARDPEDFWRRGILRLDQIVEELWNVLRELAGNDASDEEWVQFRLDVEGGRLGDYSILYGAKTGSPSTRGPYGLLVREIHLDPLATHSHDYLDFPETAEDIAICFQSVFGIDLGRRFQDVTQPCIVKFRSEHVWHGATSAALWYCLIKLRENRLTPNANGGRDTAGQAVPPEDVVAVEIVA